MFPNCKRQTSITELEEKTLQELLLNYELKEAIDKQEQQ